jgi:hypothetical protein
MYPIFFQCFKFFGTWNSHDSNFKAFGAISILYFIDQWILNRFSHLFFCMIGLLLMVRVLIFFNSYKKLHVHTLVLIDCVFQI